MSAVGKSVNFARGSTVLYLFRNDLRITDNPCLQWIHDKNNQESQQ